MSISKQLKSRFVLAMLVLLILLTTLVTATFAWYIYQTGAHTTNLHMAVGAGATLRISNTYSGDYGTSTQMEAFTGLLNPVSTDRIRSGFQKVYGFTRGKENQPALVANLFGGVADSDFYKTTLYVRATGGERPVYLSDIGYEDSDKEFPISTAIRVGLVVHEQGTDKPAMQEYIFEINKEHHEGAAYNTWDGEDGYVLDSSKTDGTVVKYNDLYSEDHFCIYDDTLGTVSLKPDTKELFRIKGADNGDFGEPVQVDVYIWLEGCDKDCTNDLCEMTLSNLALSFASGNE